MKINKVQPELKDGKFVEEMSKAEAEHEKQEIWRASPKL